MPAGRWAWEQVGVILHLQCDLNWCLSKSEELHHLVDFGLHGAGRQPAVERALAVRWDRAVWVSAVVVVLQDLCDAGHSSDWCHL